MNQGVAAALFSLRSPKTFENEKKFLCLKIAEIDMEGRRGLIGLIGTKSSSKIVYRVFKKKGIKFQDLIL